MPTRMFTGEVGQVETRELEITCPSHGTFVPQCQQLLGVWQCHSLSVCVSRAFESALTPGGPVNEWGPYRPVLTSPAQLL